MNHVKNVYIFRDMSEQYRTNVLFIENFNAVVSRSNQRKIRVVRLLIKRASNCHQNTHNFWRRSSGAGN